MQNNVTNKLNTLFIQNRLTFDLNFSIFATAGCKSDFVCKALLPTYSIGGATLHWHTTHCMAAGACFRYPAANGMSLGTKAFSLRVADEFLCGHWNSLGTVQLLDNTHWCASLQLESWHSPLVMVQGSACGCQVVSSSNLAELDLFQELFLWDVNHRTFATELHRVKARAAALWCLGSTWQTWLILPVVICLSQRLSHACLSISFYTAKLRMAY